MTDAAAVAAMTVEVVGDFQQGRANNNMRWGKTFGDTVALTATVAPMLIATPEVVGISTLVGIGSLGWSLGSMAYKSYRAHHHFPWQHN